MKRIITNNGGQPIRLNDLDYLQDNVTDLTISLAKSFGAGPFRLYGADISVTDSGGVSPLLNISFGAIYYNFNIYLVDAVVNQALASGTTLNDILTTRYWDLSQVDSDSRVFLDSTSNNILRTEKAVFVATPTTWSTNVPANILLAIDYQINHIESWNNVTFEPNWTNYPANALTQYKKDFLGNVYIKGALYSTVAGSDIAIPFILPSGYIPLERIFSSVAYNDTIVPVVIEPTGEFGLILADHTIPIYFNFSFRID